jgi:hypothetical protein
VKAAVRDGIMDGDVRLCWMALTGLDAVAAFADVVSLKHQMLARPE